ncbi:esterase-like activity of phytase family protein [Leptolyngbya sp. PCC 6406]|uniref:esterase-like activity of phytase family protein n=1 Tax=Leptolyngbya sp. PCC 6406 TaxID=1173264 RepID=UPI0006848006|nr:esterase-like activity of phytase family protein [Leptolyngbya sp. PCC 6406]
MAPWVRSLTIALLFLTSLIGLLGLGGCTLPQVQAEDRLFLPLAVDFLDVVTLPPQSVEDTPVGGLSALAYDPRQSRFYALSDDRGNLAPPRIYTLDLPLVPTGDGGAQIGTAQVTGVILLRDSQGQPYAPNLLDPEGLALSPRNSWFVSSEGVPSSGSPPALNEYDLTSGQLRTQLRLPDRYLPNDPAVDPDLATDSAMAKGRSKTIAPDATAPRRGTRNNLGLEGLTLSPTAASGDFEPFRLFTALESALAQDFDPDPAQPLVSRFLHYLIGPNQSTLISEHAYGLSLEPLGSIVHGLSEILALDQAGHFLGLERAYGLRGFDVKLWQLATGGATDTTGITTLSSLSEGINPIRKQLVLNFADLGEPSGGADNLVDNPVDNLEGMALGPPLPDGSPSLWLISDDNFSSEQVTQVWLFRLRGLQ